MSREKTGKPNAAVSFWKRVYLDPEGRIHVRQGRWKFIVGYAKRCPYCHHGILWIQVERPRRRIAIEPWSWDGEDWYTKGIHKPHVRKCVGMRTRVLARRPAIDPNLLI